MLARRLSFLLALALLGSLLALAPAGADPLFSEVGLSQTTAPTAPSADPLARKAPLRCSSKDVPQHDDDEVQAFLKSKKGKVRWCGGQVRDLIGPESNGFVESADGSALLDVDVTIPARGTGPFPLIVMLHGLSGSRQDLARESTGYASRGYAVLDYTARGNWNDRCLDDAPSATVKGAESVYESYDPSLACQTQLASRRYEVKDTQHLAGKLVDGTLVSGVTARRGIGVYGVSYGGGQTWMLTRDNTWRSPARNRVQVKAAVPVIGWSDLLDALLPNGSASDTKNLGPEVEERINERMAERRGVLKESYMATFLAGMRLASGGKLPGYLFAWSDAVLAGEPYDGNPVMDEATERLLTERSALFMQKEKGKPAILSIQGFTDVIFPVSQPLSMYNLLNPANRKSPYPMNLYFGDFGHPIAQNKEAERAHVNELVGKWFDHYLKGKGEAPKRRVEARTTRCDDSDLPGALYRARTWTGLQQPDEQVLAFETAGSLDTTVDDPRALELKPIDIDQGSVDYSRCRITEEPVADGNLGVTTTRLEAPLTMLGLPTVSFSARPDRDDMYVSARLWDLDSDGKHTLVDRGVFRLQDAVADSDPSSVALFKLFGNAYRFEQGHRIQLELTAVDSPSFLAPNAEGTIEISDITLSLPLAKPGAAVVGSQE